MNKCPICKAPMVCQDYYDSDIHMTVEEHQFCKDGCGIYGYEYAYGSSLTEIGSVRIYRWHGHSKTRRKKLSFIENQVLRKERKRWKRKNLSKAATDDKRLNH